MQFSGAMPVQPWMRAAETLAVLLALAAEGGTARFVGGCVRDALVGYPVEDIDLAVDRQPQDSLRLLQAAGIRTIPTGLEHGTVTAVAGARHFEITALRVDVEAFGRHARIAFTDDWGADAARRDFTMNALFADPDGTLYDPTGGLADLKAGRVRFVGVAAERIEEDYLRILRYFRFHAWYGRGRPDDEALAACRSHAGGLDRLSGERLRKELLRLLAAPEPRPALRLMAESGVLGRLLPGQAGLAALDRLMTAEMAVDPLLRLAALCPNGAEAAEAVAAHLRLSAAERERLSFLRAPPERPAEGDGDASLRRMAYRHGNARMAELARLEGDGALAARLQALDVPAFPLQGRDVLALGLQPGPAVGRLLRAVEADWIAGDFTADRTTLLEELKRRAAG
ncbi:MAG TPA: CCA tRNA nucleotidyltransferase [Alphaproteobacteria bacterium]|nr:CCA tRNA nucleotidyltransferase [Alphaproteobacteria bacterium]